MGTPFISVTSNLDDQLKPIIKKLQRVPRNLKDAGKEVVRQSRLNLSSSIRTDDKPFAPLKSGENRRPLLKTYRMFNSFKSSVVNGGQTVLIFNTAPYSGFQNRFRGGLREFISAEFAGKIVFEQLKDYLAED